MKSILIGLPLVTMILGACGVPRLASDAAAVHDVLSMQVRPDGAYDVLCRSGIHEIATAEQISRDDVCRLAPPAASIAEIISMQNRGDGIFEVICRSGAHEVRRADEIRRGEVCAPQPVEHPCFLPEHRQGRDCPAPVLHEAFTTDDGCFGEPSLILRGVFFQRNGTTGGLRGANGTEVSLQYVGPRMNTMPGAEGGQRYWVQLSGTEACVFAARSTGWVVGKSITVTNSDGKTSNAVIGAARARW